MKTIGKTTKVRFTTLEYPEHRIIEPCDMFSFSLEYLESIPKLIKYITKKRGKFITLDFIRMKGDGSLLKKQLSGVVKEVENGRFIFSTHQNMDGSINEQEQDLLIRTDSILGRIPLLNAKIFPFNEKPNKLIKGYLPWLNEVKSLMRSCLGKNHYIIFFWKYDESHVSFREGNYRIEGKIMEVNESNVKYKHFRTVSYPPQKEKRYIDIIPRDEIDRYVAPDRYLKKIVICLGAENNTNPYDDE